MPVVSVYATAAGNWLGKSGDSGATWVWSKTSNTGPAQNINANGTTAALSIGYWSWVNTELTNGTHSGANLSSATLRTLGADSLSISSGVHTASSDPSTASGNVAPPMETVNGVGFASSSASTTLVVTNEVQGWIDGTDTSYGFLIGENGKGAAAYEGYDNTYITIDYSIYSAPIISPVTANGATFPHTGSVTLQSQITDADSGETLVTTFEVRNSSGTLVDTKTSSVTGPRTLYTRSGVFSGLGVGDYTWRSRVYDGTSYSAWTPTRSFSVYLVSTLPTITPVSPTQGAIFPAESANTIPLKVRVNDPDPNQSLTILFEVRLQGTTSIIWNTTVEGTSPDVNQEYTAIFSGEVGTNYEWYAAVLEEGDINTASFTDYFSFSIEDIPPPLRRWEGASWVALEDHMRMWDGNRWVAIRHFS